MTRGDFLRRRCKVISRAWLYRDVGCGDRHAHHGRSTPISRRSPLGKVRVSVSAKCSDLSKRAAALLKSSPRSARTAVRMMMLPVSRAADGNSVDLSNPIATFQVLGETEVSATDRTEYPAPATRLDRGSFRRLPRCGGAAIGMLFALALAGCDEKARSQSAAPPPLVTVAQPVKRTVTDWDEFTGRFEAIQEVQVRARVGGFVNSVDFKDGAIVRAGDLLYIIDPRPFEAVAVQAEGQLADARAKGELAKRDLERALKLVQTSAVSEQAVDQRRQSLQAARAAETQANGALKAARLNVEFTHVVAPITGRVSRHLVTPGNLVQGSEGGATLLTSIVSLDPIYIYFDVDEATYQRDTRLWFDGQRPSSRDTPNPVQVTLTGETKPSHEGKMDFLDNRLDVSTATLRSRAIIPNKDSLDPARAVRPGPDHRHLALRGAADPGRCCRHRPVAQDCVRGQGRQHGGGKTGCARATR